MEVAVILDKTLISAMPKIWNLGLSLKEKASAKQLACSSSLDLSRGLPSVEEKLKVLNAALVALEKPGLGRTEVLRLWSIIMGGKLAGRRFEKYVGYRELELRLWSRKVSRARCLYGFSWTSCL